VKVVDTMKKYQCSLMIISFSLLLFSCKTNKQVQSSQNATSNTNVSQQPEVVDFGKSPFISPEASISKMIVEDGFEVKLIAAEPLVSTPVAMLFDDKARMWVVEMTGYMPDTTGAGEDIPNGKIVILDDKNGDGVYDDRKVFLDSLVLPRAICFVDGGILVAEPSNLWFYEISNDKPVNKLLVDDKYAVGGNVEHQPNGLLRALDNWIYNAKSDRRYRRIGGKWVFERTHFRGQWGIAQDNYGRLYYNNNSQNLLGDYFAPGFGAQNRYQRGVAGFNEKSVANNKVYPIRPTPGVNRGYMKNVLNDSLKLNEFTAAAGPIVYRGSLFGKAYEWNAFTPEPSANLIKRNILNEKGYVVQGQQAYKDREFLASTDERFRPVNLYDAPDGSIIVLDMYRGIIQHKTYLTPYLADQIGKRGLTQPLASGRIYKILPKNSKTKMVTLSDDPNELVKLLGHSDGWVRDKAQQKLIDVKSTQVIPALRSAVQQKQNPLFAIHALWTLEGLGALTTDEVLGLVHQPTWPLRMTALTAIPSVISKDNYNQISGAFDLLLSANDTLAAPYVAFLTPWIKKYDQKAATTLLTKLAVTYPQSKFVADAVISNLQDDEEVFQKELSASLTGTNFVVQNQLQKVIANAKSARANRNPEILKKQFPKGEALFTSICQTCHGLDGNGVKSLGPPLNQSEWVTGSREKLISVVLFGLTGPIKVNGHTYQAPEISGDMPGIGYDKDMPNEDIAQLLSYIRKSWRNNADNVTTEEVAKTRQKLSGRQKAFTEAELEGI
jgi:mono/diheme cytochrome c family protein/glucose/arabinose dehydrogenase